MCRSIAIVAMVIVVAISAVACGSSTTTTADTQSASPSPLASPSPEPTSWAEMLAGKWESKTGPAKRLVFKSDVAQASIQHRGRMWPLAFVFYGERCTRTMGNLHWGPYQLDAAGTESFTGIYSWDYVGVGHWYIIVKSSGRTLTVTEAQDDLVEGVAFKYRYTLSDDGQSILYREWGWGEASPSTLFIRQ